MTAGPNDRHGAATDGHQWPVVTDQCQSRWTSASDAEHCCGCSVAVRTAGVPRPPCGPPASRPESSFKCDPPKTVYSLSFQLFLPTWCQRLPTRSNWHLKPESEAKSRTRKLGPGRTPHGPASTATVWPAAPLGGGCV